MATSSLSSLTVAFSSLSFSSHVSSSNKTLYSPWIRRRRTASPLRWNSPTAIASSTTSFPIAAVSGGAAVSAEDLEEVSLEKYVKSRLPGGFAAQRLIGTGRRKCAIARVVLQEGTGKFVINYRDAKEYLQGNPLWLQYIKTPLLTLGFESSYDVFVKAQGGGLAGQAQAISLGIARALLKVSQNHRSPLKKEGLLTRDSRIVERKKVGLKKARKAPQFSKR